jgi:hypothetical protein
VANGTVVVLALGQRVIEAGETAAPWHLVADLLFDLIHSARLRVAPERRSPMPARRVDLADRAERRR